MALAKRDEGSKVNSDINVTPMVDVMLVLLIIFMVVTPMLQHGAPVDMVQAENPINMQDADKEDAILIAITKNGGIFLGSNQVKPEELTGLVQDKLTWMISEITKAQLLVLQVGRLKDAGKIEPQHISMAKRNNVWMALECARLSRDILGANGVADDYPIMRHMMNLESVKTYEGTHDIHTLIIGANVTGIDAF